MTTHTDIHRPPLGVLRTARVLAVIAATAALALPATASADGIYTSSQLQLSDAQSQIAPATTTTIAKDSPLTSPLTNIANMKHENVKAAAQNTR